MYVTVVDHAVQTSDGIWEETVSLREEVATLRAAVDEAKDQLLDREDSKLSLIRSNDAKAKLYTGLPSFAVFMALFTFLEPKMGKVSVWSGNSGRDITRGESSKGRKRKLSLEEELLAVLMRLRLGLLLEDMADRFDIAKGTVSKLFTTWIKVLAVELKTVFPWPSNELVLQKNTCSVQAIP